METLRRWNHDVLTLIRRNQRVFNICQVGFYGTTLSCMLLATIKPEITTWIEAKTNTDFEKYALSRLAVRMYEEKNLLGAAGITFAINVLVGAFGSMTLYSAIIPYAGLALGLYRAGYWGLLFPPNGKLTSWAHLITLVLEGQAYIFAGFGAWLLSDAIVGSVRDWWKAKRGIRLPDESEVQGPKEPRLWTAVVDNAKLYIPIMGILAVSAVWEAYEVIHLGIDKANP